MNLNNDVLNYKIDFVIPRGEAGLQGAMGPKGDPGLQGPQGEIGPTGPAPKLVIGTVTTAAPGTNASVTITPNIS